MNSSEQQELLIVDTGLPVALELAEMKLTKRDLENSLASFTVWVERYHPGGGQNESERAINGSLFRDGITQFVGCFDSKNATLSSWKPSIQTLTE